MNQSFKENYKEIAIELKKRHKRFPDESAKIKNFNIQTFGLEILSILTPEQIKSILDKYSPVDYLIVEKAKKDKAFRKEVLSRL